MDRSNHPNLVGTLLLGLAACVTPLAHAQTPAPANWSERNPADAGFEDVSPLGDSFRLEPVDLRQGTGFERVYKLGTEQNEGTSRELFARSNGAVTAVFPRADYVATRRGTVAIAPADTLYVIGSPPEWLMDRLGMDQPDFRVRHGTAQPEQFRIDDSISTRLFLEGIDPRAIRHRPDPEPSVTIGPYMGEVNRDTVRILMRWAVSEAENRRSQPEDAQADQAQRTQTSGQMQETGAHSGTDPRRDDTASVDPDELE